MLSLEYSCMVQDGKRIAISKSKIKNRIITRKNLVENEELFLDSSLNPHSNCVFFSFKYIWVWEVVIIVITRKLVTINATTRKEDKFISFVSL